MGSYLGQVAHGIEHQAVSSIDHPPAAHVQGEVEGDVALAPKVLRQSPVIGQLFSPGQPGRNLKNLRVPSAPAGQFFLLWPTCQ